MKPQPPQQKLQQLMKKIVPTITGKTPYENREVVLYDHFVGDNSSLKFIIKFREKKKVFFNFILCTEFGVSITQNWFQK